MNKRKLILGVFIIALGGIIMLTSMVSGIIYFAANLYEDIHTFPAKLPDSPLSSKTDNFREKRGNEVSVWLKVHNRQIENKDFVISVSIVEENGKKKAEFAENFRFGYLRNSAGKGQYYKLGSHLFENDFSGYLSYTTSGTWIPPFEGFLVIRRSQGLPLPLRQISVFLIGIIILITGIGNIAKNRKRSAID